MLRRFLLGLCLVLFTSSAFAQNNLTWLQWKTDNFVIYSIDKDQGEFIQQNVEPIKTWCLTRWGLPDVQFATPIKLHCCQNSDLMKKLFRSSQSHVENKNVRLILDVSPAADMPPAVTIVCLTELERQYEVSFGWWVYRGLPLMNSSLPSIKEQFQGLDERNRSSRSIFKLTRAEWLKMAPEQRDKYDRDAAITCLLIRREYGQKKFLNFLKDNESTEKNLQELGFTSYEDFDTTLHRYVTNLVSDLKKGKTPNSYFQIQPVK